LVNPGLIEEVKQNFLSTSSVGEHLSQTLLLNETEISRALNFAKLTDLISNVEMNADYAN
jgi:hypothetical protein